ncbi:MAG: D-aminoacyl-tRNA deacylase [Acutalibacteraceae bacterium]
MKAVVQRVTGAKVSVEGKTVSEIGKGFLVLLGVEVGDDEDDARTLAAKISGLRVFTDENDKMNLALTDVNGGMLVVSNFTLCADCKKGRRPSFEKAELPNRANELYVYFCECVKKNNIPVQKGVFGADMQVTLNNDGPVTLIINSKELTRIN